MSRYLWIGLIGAGLAAAVLPGCSSGGTSNSNSNSGGQNESCGELSADAQVDFDDNPNDDLVATAQTAQCGEVVIFSGDGQEVRQAVIVSGESEVQAEFDEDGQLVAARTDVASLSTAYNDDLGYARLTYEDDTTTASNVIAISRDDQTNARTSNGTSLDFCRQLEQFASVLRSGCAGANPPPYCSGSLAEASSVATSLCSATDIRETNNIAEFGVSAVRQRLPLGIDGFGTTRPAAGGGTTIILSASAFGGVPAYDIDWSQGAGQNATLTQLPGGSAVADVTTSTGRFVFEASVRDAAGTMARGEVEVDLGSDGFIGAVVQASDLTPDVNQAVNFAAAQTAMGQAGLSDLTVFWDFGDGSSALGSPVTHSYSSVGIFNVTMVVALGDELLAGNVQVTVGGGGGQRVEDFVVMLDIGAPEFLTPGESRTVRAEVRGAIGEAEAVIGVLEGFDIATLGGGPIEDGVLLSSTGTLQVDDVGVVALGAVAVDSAGRFAETIIAFPVCGPEGGLLAAIFGPLETGVGLPTVYTGDAVGCGQDLSNATYSWSSPDPGVTISGAQTAQPTLTAQQPGVVTLDLAVTDSLGNFAAASFGVLVLGADFDELVVEFTGPFRTAVNAVAPLSLFIDGGFEPYFCAWAFDSFNVEIEDEFSCSTAIQITQPGCYEGQLLVQDARGVIGETFFEICTFDDASAQDCILDGACDVGCQNIDPDCFNDFCIPGDQLCLPRCSPPDPDCALCGMNGVCVVCPTEDPDCDFDFEICVANDGDCDVFCSPVDPDCGSDNTIICAENDVCCDFDGRCDMGPCVIPDADCPAAPCDVTFDCDPDCPEDPECIAECDQTFDCDPNCPEDPECFCGDGLCSAGESPNNCPEDCF